MYLNAPDLICHYSSACLRNARIHIYSAGARKGILLLSKIRASSPRSFCPVISSTRTSQALFDNLTSTTSTRSETPTIDDGVYMATRQVILHVHIASSMDWKCSHSVQAWEFQHPNFKINRKDLLEGIKVK